MQKIADPPTVSYSSIATSHVTGSVYSGKVKMSCTTYSIVSQMNLEFGFSVGACSPPSPHARKKYINLLSTKRLALAQV